MGPLGEREKPMGSSAGRHFLQIPGPTNIPEQVLRAMAKPTIDHRSEEFALLTREVVAGLQQVLQTQGKLVIYPSSGTGAWEAALVNTLSPGDRVLMFETGHFATLWANMARKLGLDVDFVPGDWRLGVDPAQVEEKLKEDRRQQIKAVAVVHNETSTGVTSRIAAIRRAMDEARHPALLLVDTISSLGSLDYRHDEWGVDVTVACSQKGLMLPPGLGINAISPKARAAAPGARLPRSYWDWQEMIENMERGFFPYSPATNLLFGLKESLFLLFSEGMENIIARHNRHGEATRRAVRAWGLDILCRNPEEVSGVLTAVIMPSGYDEIAFRKYVLERFNMSLGSGLGKLRGWVFRIGHLGNFNDLMLAGTLAGLEMAMTALKMPIRKGGVTKALEYLARE
jgi:alanine-glyoxylate transaminase/serine-glyoxylate transaminase/serine-pyruvate transaminase